MKGRMKKAFTALLAATVLVGGMPVNMQANVIAETEKAESTSEKVNEKYADTEELDLMDRERQETQAGEQEKRENRRQSSQTQKNSRRRQSSQTQKQNCRKWKKKQKNGKKLQSRGTQVKSRLQRNRRPGL